MGSRRTSESCRTSRRGSPSRGCACLFQTCRGTGVLTVLFPTSVPVGSAGENLVRELTVRGLLDPERTILVGHSLGGAIALRVASRVPVAGVIAISPAPMRTIVGVAPEMMPFHDFGALPAHSLVMSAAWEPERIRAGAKDLVPTPGDGTSEYVVIPRSTHVSILFDGTAMSSERNWAARVLHLESQLTLPSHRGLLGFLAGFAGILLLAGPFLRETLQSKNARRHH